MVIGGGGGGAKGTGNLRGAPPMLSDSQGGDAAEE